MLIRQDHATHYMQRYGACILVWMWLKHYKKLQTWSTQQEPGRRMVYSHDSFHFLQWNLNLSFWPSNFPGLLRGLPLVGSVPTGCNFPRVSLALLLVNFSGVHAPGIIPGKLHYFLQLKTRDHTPTSGERFQSFGRHGNW